MKTELEFLEKIKDLLTRLSKESEKMSFHGYTDFQVIRLSVIPKRIQELKQEAKE